MTLPAFGVHESRPDDEFQPSEPETELWPDEGPDCEIVSVKVEPARMFSDPQFGHPQHVTTKLPKLTSAGGVQEDWLTPDH